MKTLVLILFALTPLTAFAQITVTGSALPVVGETWGLYLDSNGGAQFAITPPGPAPQNWDYTDAFDVDYSIGQTWADPSVFPGSALFPDANLAQVFAGSEGAEFHHAGADGLYDRGFYSETPSYSNEFHITNGLVLPVPFTYGSSRDFSRRMTDLRLYTDGSPAERVEFYSERSFVCDAWGTVRTPAYPEGVEVLRIAQAQFNSFDSVFVDATGTGNGPWVFDHRQDLPSHLGYVFVQDQAPCPVLSITDDLSQASYTSSELPIGVAEGGTPPRASVAYPVPCAGDVVHIALDHPEVSTVQVCNAIGQQVLALPVRGVNVVTIATTAWGAGTYTYRCLRSDGSLVDRGRFLIVR